MKIMSIIAILNRELKDFSVEAKINVFGNGGGKKDGIYFYDSAQNSFVAAKFLEECFDQLTLISCREIPELFVPENETMYIPLGQCKKIEKLLSV